MAPIVEKAACSKCNSRVEIIEEVDYLEYLILRIPILVEENRDNVGNIVNYAFRIDV